MNFPIEVNIDATSLRSSSCMLEFYRKIVDGYRLPVLSCDIVYGIAVHKFIDTMFKTGGDIKKATTEAYKAFRIPKFPKEKKPHMMEERHMLTTSINYWDDYIVKDKQFNCLLLPNNEPATELTFRFLYYEDEFIKVYLCGTIDKLGKISGGCFAIGDYKTTSSWDKNNYFSGYELSVQLRFYNLALRWMGKNYPESVLGQVGNSNVGAFIDALFIKPNAMENEYKRSNVFTYSDTEMSEFESMLRCKIQELSHYVSQLAGGHIQRMPKQGILQGTCERKFGICEFAIVCQQQKEEFAEFLLNRDFIKKHYNPLKFNE